jgi:hypothetical protein
MTISVNKHLSEFSLKIDDFIYLRALWLFVIFIDKNSQIVHMKYQEMAG